MNFCKKIIIFLALLKNVQNQLCPNWADWKSFKTNFSITFFNSSLELIGYNLYFYLNEYS
jgi:hypothetical protein